jgi:hypothetical protein
MATTKNPTIDPLAAAETATQQLQEFGERAADSGRVVGRLVLDAYEQAVKTLIEFEKRAAEAAPVEWVKTALSAHASFVGDINSAYLKAVRDAIN